MVCELYLNKSAILKKDAYYMWDSVFGVKDNQNTGPILKGEKK